MNIFEIDGDDAPFLFQQGTKRIHILLCDASTDAQHHEILADNPWGMTGHLTVRMLCRNASLLPQLNS